MTTGQFEKKISSVVFIASSALTAVGCFSAIQGLPVLSEIGIVSNSLSSAIPLVYSALKGTEIIRIDRIATLDEGFKKVLFESLKQVKKMTNQASAKRMINDLNDIIALKILKGEIDSRTTFENLLKAINQSIEYYVKIEKEEFDLNEKRQFIEQVSREFLVSLAFNPEIGIYYNSVNIAKVIDILNSFDSKIKKNTRDIEKLQKAISNLHNLIINYEFRIELIPVGLPKIGFVGREDFLNHVNCHFSFGRALLVYGMGGIGKTEFCRYYCHFEKKRSGWFEYKGSLEETLLAIGDPNKVNFKQFRNTEYQRVKHFLQTLNSDTIIIIDNVDQLDNINDIDFLNQLECKVILTSRNSQNAFDEDIVALRLDSLGIEECIEVFKNRLGHIKANNKNVLNKENGVLKKIVERAGCHTLAIELLAGIYGESSKYKCLQDLLDELAANGFNLREKVMRNRNSDNREFMDHFKKLFDISGVTKDKKKMYVLKNIAIFGMIQTPRKQILNWISLDMEIAYKELRDSSWISEQNYIACTHDLICEAIKAQVAPRYDDYEIMIEVMTHELSFNATDLARFNPPYFQQNTALGKYISGNNPRNRVVAVFFNNIAGVYEAKGEYEEALKYYMLALEIREKVLKTEFLDTAANYNNIASVYDGKGEYHEALVWYQKALTIYVNELGTAHPDIARIYHNIATAYDAQAEYVKALEWYNKALRIRETVLGVTNLDTSETYSSIAGVYDAQGDYHKALELYQKALKIRERVLGTEHPTISVTYNNMALVYQNLKEYSTALIWHKKALKIRETVLGVKHPSTANAYHNLAGIHYFQEEYPKALDLYKKALAIREKSLGTTHPDTAATYNNMAKVYQAQGKYTHALKYYGRAMNALYISVGTNHPNSKRLFENLKACYYENGGVEDGFEEWLTINYCEDALRAKSSQ